METLCEMMTCIQYWSKVNEGHIQTCNIFLPLQRNKVLIVHFLNLFFCSFQDFQFENLHSSYNGSSKSLSAARSCVNLHHR